MPRSFAKKRSSRTDVFWGAFLLLVTTAVVGGIVVYKLLNPTPNRTALLCPETGAKAHFVVLVDKTDPLSFTQKKAFQQFVAKLAGGEPFISSEVSELLDEKPKPSGSGNSVSVRSKWRLREGDLLSVYVLGEDFRDTAEPIFEKCHPGDGSGKNQLDANPRILRRDFDKDFRQPILDLENSLRADDSAKRSPIFEMLQIVGLRFSRYSVSGPRRLVIVSDMLHNTDAYSLYKGKRSFERLNQQAPFAKLRSDLRSVDVTILLLRHQPSLQNRTLVKFWQDYFSSMGARLRGIQSLPG